jgi:hypothetical protein
MILFISANDYANFSHDMAKSLRTVYPDTLDLTLHAHKFHYPSESTLVSKSIMLHQIKQASQVHIMHSEPFLLEMVLSTTQRNIVVWHTGTRYRQEPERFNALFNPHVKMSILALGEFWNLGAKNQQYMVGAVDTDRLQPSPTQSPTRIKHLPSNPIVKGTDEILKIMSEITGEYDFQYKLDPCDYDQQLELMKECEIYIELFAPTQDGKPYGSFGITALEAAALGKVVLTQHNSKAVYFEQYGIDTPFESYSDRRLYKQSIQMLVNAPSMVATLQRRTREWVVLNHSYVATGARLAKLLKD